MIAQWIKEEGRKEGNTLLLSRQFVKKYRLAPDNVAAVLEGLRSDQQRTYS